MTITYRIKAPKGADIPASAPSAEALDQILYDYYQLRGNLTPIRIEPVVNLGVVRREEVIDLVRVSTEPQMGRGRGTARTSQYTSEHVDPFGGDK